LLDDYERVARASGGLTVQVDPRDFQQIMRLARAGLRPAGAEDMERAREWLLKHAEHVQTGEIASLATEFARVRAEERDRAMARLTDEIASLRSRLAVCERALKAAAFLVPPHPEGKT
jgi:hypothetical protein